MSAAAKAEARRKAILGRGSDRLAKLKTSARGEDATYMRDESPPVGSHTSNVRNFVGEESIMPTPPRAPSGPATPPSSQRKPSSGAPENDPSAWSEEQQQQLLQALMGQFGARGGPNFPGQPAIGGAPGAPQVPPSLADNPLAAIFFGAAGAQGGGNGMPPFPPPGMGLGKSPAMDGGVGTQVKTPKQSKLQKLMPLVHLVAIWALLAYFVLIREPEAQTTLHGEAASWSSTDWKSAWRRWAELAHRSPYAVVDSTVGQGWTVAVMPFFWAFMTLQIVLHSTRIFYGFDAPQPPALLAMVLPHLPPPFPSLIVNGLKYIQLGSILLDDLAILAVGTGFVIWIAGLLSSM